MHHLEQLSHAFDGTAENRSLSTHHDRTLEKTRVLDDGGKQIVFFDRLVVETQIPVRSVPLSEHVAGTEVCHTQNRPEFVGRERRREVVHALEVDPLRLEKLYELLTRRSGRLFVDRDQLVEHGFLTRGMAGPQETAIRQAPGSASAAGR